MKKNDRVKLVKVSDDVFGGNHPNYINTGYTVIGVLEEFPKVGERFRLHQTLSSGITTSKVTEIVDDFTFKTENSTYKLEVYENN